MLKKKSAQFIFSLFLIFSKPSYAVFPVTDYIDLGFDIGGLVESAYSAASDVIREVSDELRTTSRLVSEAYDSIISTEAVQTTINTYDTLVEAKKIYDKTVYMLSILEGNPGYSAIMRVAGDHDIRNLMGKDWSYMVDQTAAFESTFSGTDARMRRAFDSFNSGHLPYDSNLVYVHPSLVNEKDIYEKDIAKNKAAYVTAHSAISRAEEKVIKLTKMEAAANATELPKERDALRNQFLIDIYQESTETNKTLSMLLLQQNEQIKKDMNRRATDKLMTNTPMHGW